MRTWRREISTAQVKHLSRSGANIAVHTGRATVRDARRATQGCATRLNGCVTPQQQTIRVHAALGLFLALPLALTACASDASTSQPAATSSSTIAVPASSLPAVTPSASATSATSSASTPAASTSQATRSASAATTQPSSAKASSTATRSVTATTAPIGLPDEFAGFTKVESSNEGRWDVAGYAEGSTVVQVRAARTPNDLQTVLKSIVGSTGTKFGSGYCGQRERVSACVRKTGDVTVAVVSKDLETEELSSLLPNLFEAMG